jgi:septum site-determining protein MinC
MVVVTSAAQIQPTIRFRGRSFMAFGLTPEAPIADWLTELDNSIRTSPGFFIGRAVVLDLSAVTLSESAIGHLIVQLGERGIRIMGIEGCESSELGASLPPVLKGGRPASGEPVGPALATAGTAAPAARQEPASLLIETPIRSGQSVTFPYGDVTVLGSVASGAEVVAGGSIHIYGALRGRAMAGAMGNARARIFCSRNEAELLAIDGYYRTAEDMAADLRGLPVQAWLEGAGLLIEALG